MSPAVCPRCSKNRSAIRVAQAEVQRLARRMTRSERLARITAPQLATAKQNLAEGRRIHELHLAECDGLEFAPHGSTSKYNNYGCRCDECREANRLYTRNRREVRPS